MGQFGPPILTYILRKNDRIRKLITLYRQKGGFSHFIHLSFQNGNISQSLRDLTAASSSKTPLLTFDLLIRLPYWSECIFQTAFTAYRNKNGAPFGAPRSKLDRPASFAPLLYPHSRPDLIHGGLAGQAEINDGAEQTHERTHGECTQQAGADHDQSADQSANEPDQE
jgi:hypothetical protein